MSLDSRSKYTDQIYDVIEELSRKDLATGVRDSLVADLNKLLELMSLL